MRQCSYKYSHMRSIRNPIVVAAPDVGWLESSAVLLLIVAGCLLCFCSSISSCRPVSLFSIAFSFFFFTHSFIFPFFFAFSLVCLAYICCLWPQRSLRFAMHILVSQFVTAELVPLMLNEASARKLVVLDVDGWK